MRIAIEANGQRREATIQGACIASEVRVQAAKLLDLDPTLFRLTVDGQKVPQSYANAADGQTFVFTLKSQGVAAMMSEAQEDIQLRKQEMMAYASSDEFKDVTAQMTKKAVQIAVTTVGRTLDAVRDMNDAESEEICQSVNRILKMFRLGTLAISPETARKLVNTAIDTVAGGVDKLK